MAKFFGTKRRHELRGARWLLVIAAALALFWWLRNRTSVVLDVVGPVAGSGDGSGFPVRDRDLVDSSAVLDFAFPPGRVGVRPLPWVD